MREFGCCNSRASAPPPGVSFLPPCLLSRAIPCLCLFPSAPALFEGRVLSYVQGSCGWVGGGAALEPPNALPLPFSRSLWPVPHNKVSRSRRAQRYTSIYFNFAAALCQTPLYLTCVLRLRLAKRGVPYSFCRASRTYFAPHRCLSSRAVHAATLPGPNLPVAPAPGIHYGQPHPGQAFWAGRVGAPALCPVNLPMFEMPAPGAFCALCSPKEPAIPLSEEGLYGGTSLLCLFLSPILCLVRHCLCVYGPPTPLLHLAPWDPHGTRSLLVEHCAWNCRDPLLQALYGE